MEDLLREFLELALEEMKDARVPNQLRSRKQKKNLTDDEKNEMSTVAGSLAPGGGYIAPMGASSADMKPGKHPTAGKKVKKQKKDHVRVK